MRRVKLQTRLPPLLPLLEQKVKLLSAQAKEIVKETKNNVESFKDFILTGIILDEINDRLRPERYKTKE